MVSPRHCRYGLRSWALLDTPFLVAAFENGWRVQPYEGSPAVPLVRLAKHAQDYLDEHRLTNTDFPSRRDASRVVLSHLNSFPASWPSVPLPPILKTSPRTWQVDGHQITEGFDHGFRYRLATCIADVRHSALAASLTEARYICGLLAVERQLAAQNTSTSVT